MSIKLGLSRVPTLVNNKECGDEYIVNISLVYL